MNITLPHTGNTTALFVIDVQPETLHACVSDYPARITRFIENTTYDAYVLASYHSDKDSVFYLQEGWHLPKDKAGDTCRHIAAAVKAKDKPVITVEKQVRSCFKGPNAEEHAAFVQHHAIKEAHVLGFDINECVLTSALEAADLGMYTAVIEELSHHHRGDAALREHAIAVLRHQKMTNHSLLPHIPTRTLSF